jgi:phage replication initiation protein
LDWLSGTFPADVTLEDALRFLGEDFAFNGVRYDAGWLPMERGAMGYKAGVVSGHMKVFHDGVHGVERDGQKVLEPMGVHFVLSGKGVKQFLASANINTEADLRAWLTRAVAEGIVFSRSDWACDDRSADDPLLDLSVIRAAVDHGAVVSRFKSVEERRKRELVGRRGARPMKEEPALVADALYFGSIMSEMSVCFYDKAKEQLLAAGQRWVRCELRAKKDRAHAMVLTFIEKGVSAVVGVLRDYLDFREPERDTNVSRWSKCEWWDRFLNKCDRVRLAIAKPERTVERVMSWLLKQVAPSFAVVCELMDVGEVVVDLLAQGKKGWSRRHDLLVAQGRGRLCVAP